MPSDLRDHTSKFQLIVATYQHSPHPREPMRCRGAPRTRSAINRKSRAVTRAAAVHNSLGDWLIYCPDFESAE